MTKSTTGTFTAFSLGINILKHFPLDAVEYFPIHPGVLFVLECLRCSEDFQHSEIYKLPKAEALTSNETP